MGLLNKFFGSVQDLFEEVREITQSDNLEEELPPKLELKSQDPKHQSESPKGFATLRPLSIAIARQVTDSRSQKEETSSNDGRPPRQSTYSSRDKKDLPSPPLATSTQLFRKMTELPPSLCHFFTLSHRLYKLYGRRRSRPRLMDKFYYQRLQ
uniref:Uncharacterized protein n=1 Tax=Cannabis sativa TaxID=3483 RepID=A0A803PS26_CANSA